MMRWRVRWTDASDSDLRSSSSGPHVFYLRGCEPNAMMVAASGGAGQRGKRMSPAWDDEKKRLAAAMRAHPTSAESELWKSLKRRPGGLTFWNQHVVRGWIADFYCPAARLVIEVDGSSHRGREAQDQLRDEVMRAYRFAVLRFTNTDVHQDCAGVVARIVDEANHRGAQQREADMADRRQRRREAALRMERVEVTESVEAPVSNRAKAKIEYVPGRPTKSRFRCTWCLREWVANVKDAQTCRRCPGAEVDRLCKTCNLRPAHPHVLVCVPCYETSHVARGAVGRGGDEFGVGRHRARKVL